MRGSIVLTAFLLLGCSGASDLQGRTDAGDADVPYDPGRPDPVEVHDPPAETVPPDAAPWDAPDGVVVPDARHDTTYDASFDMGTSDVVPEAMPPFDPPSTCGDGVLDPGEECDDRNRLDGDGCDWMCRRGDGDPPPPPETVPLYEPAGPPVLISTVDDTYPPSPERLPLVWTGSQYATAIHFWDESDNSYIRLLRFSPDGTPAGPDWIYDIKSATHGTELAWTGSQFGLFFADRIRGLGYLPLSATGDPLAHPVVVEPDPGARAPAADSTSTGFALAWITETSGGGSGGWSWCGDWGGTPDSIRVRHVGLDGSTSGPPVEIEDFAGGPPDIAVGPTSIGVTLMTNSSPSMPSCSFRFVRLSPDLSSATHSGILSDGWAGDVGWTDGSFITAWAHYDTFTGEFNEECVARFSPAGALEGPPACNDVSSIVSDIMATRLAAGDSGLSLVFAGDADHVLGYLRTGLNGRAVDVPHNVTSACGYSHAPCHWGSFNTEWAIDGFGVAAVGHILDWGISGIFLFPFTAAP